MILSISGIFASNLACALLGVFRNLLIASALGPIDYGTYAVLVLFISYFGMLDLGVNNAGLYALSQNSQDVETFHMFRGSVLLSGLYATVLGALLFFMMSIGKEFLIVLFAIPVVVLSNYAVVKLRLAQEFRHIALSATLSALVSTAIAIYAYLIAGMSIYWALSSSLVVQLLPIIYYKIIVNRASKFDLEGCLDFKYVARFIRQGFIITLVPAMGALYLGLDRFLLNGNINASEFGAFALGCSIGMLGFNVPSAITIVVFKSFFDGVGLRQWCFSNGLNFLVLLIGGVIYLGISNLIVERFFPNYSLYISYIDLGCISVLVLALSSISMSFILANYQKVAFFVGLGAIMLKFQLLDYLIYGFSESIVLEANLYLNVLYVSVTLILGFYFQRAHEKRKKVLFLYEK